MIYRYQVQLKGIDGPLPDEPKQQHIGYKVGDHVWIKTPLKDGAHTLMHMDALQV